MPVPNYNQGVAEVTPSNEGTPYQSGAGATPDAFGAGIGEGLEKVGQGAQTAGKFFSKVAADDASNNYQDFATKLLHGDSSKTIPGPDGQPMPDTGYLGMKGRAALDQRPIVEKQLEDKAKEIRGTLQSPEQVQEFENFSRRYRVGAGEKIGSHADSQASTWYTGVNTASAKLAMDHISNNADNPNEVAAGAADLTAAYVKNAQLAGATPGSPQLTEAIASAKRDGLQAQLNAIAVKDPARALAILDKNREIAGVQYDNLAATYRGRAKQQQGFDVGNQTLKSTYAASPTLNPVALTNAGAQFGISGSYLMRTHQIEDANNSPTENSAHAAGPFQFIPETARRYGLSSQDRFDPEKSAIAAARLAADNKVSLTSSLGRPPSDPELYLAHQQGAGGAAALLNNPNVRAGDLVGDARIRQNGGDPNAPAAAFTGMWTQKFNNAPVAATANRKAQAIGAIMAIPEDQIDPDVRQHAMTYVNQQLAAQAIAEEQDSKSRKAATDKLQSDMVADIIKGTVPGPEMIQRIANSGLPANEIENLYKFATNEGGVEDPLRYGPGYTQALGRILAAPEAPGKITAPAEVIQLYADGHLSKKGVTELLGTMDKIKKQPDQAGITTVKSRQLDYYKSKMAIDSEAPNLPGVPAFKNAKGLDIFNHEFVPAFEAAYSDWIAKDKDPMAFLSDNKQMDAIMDRVYPPSQRKVDSLFASGQSEPPAPPPPAPEGVNKKSWDRLISQPPNQPDGKPWSLKSWGVAITRLRENADNPDYVNGFNTKFGPSGYTAQDILSRLPPKAKPYNDAAGLPGAIEPPAPTTIPKLLKDNAIPKEKQALGIPEDDKSLVLGPGNIMPVGVRG
jgi:hypothetical protein